jgi:aminoglycoside 6'-N-acetyltransferase
MPHDYAFRPLTEADYPMLRAWLAEPHIAGWWDPPDAEIARIDAQRAAGDRSFWIVETDGTAFAFLEEFGADGAGQPEFAGLPPGTLGLDTFIGPPDFIGWTHARHYLDARAATLFAAGTPALALAISPDNLGAVRAFRAAAFDSELLRDNARGEPQLILTRRRPGPPADSPSA